MEVIGLKGVLVTIGVIIEINKLEIMAEFLVNSLRLYFIHLKNTSILNLHPITTH